MEPSSPKPAHVETLADRYGLARSYTDGVGVRRSLEPAVLTSILSSMGVPTDAKAQQRGEPNQDSSRQLVEDVVIIPESTRVPSLVMTIPVDQASLGDESISWVIQDEQQVKQAGSLAAQKCQILEQTVIDCVPYVRLRIPLRVSLDLGYYWGTFSVRNSHRLLEGRSFLIVAPRRCYIPANPSQSFGVSVQLYNVHTSQNWGIGDFRDLRKILQWARKDLRAATIGVSPLHDPAVGVCSPYSPSSRLFYNPLYLDLEAISEFRSTPAIQRRCHSKQFQKKLDRLRASRLVQYDRVRAVKFDILDRLYRAFQSQHVQARTSRFRKFRQYCLAQREYLEPYCLFQVLSEKFGTSAWRQWPQIYQSPRSAQVQALLNTHQSRIGYFQYVQWQCELQLAGLDRLATRLNLPYRLYHDLPVGVHPDGADAWIFQEELAEGITLGAPPDPINLQGQNWGLMAPVPWRMRTAGYRFFIETLRRNMQYAGMIRIDHALGLFRLFIIPEGATGQAGTYVKTQVNEMLAIVALESVRYNVMVVGEDLGAVTPEIRARLLKGGIHSYRLMPFEKTETGKFKTPKQYPKQAIVSFSTHDLPTFQGFWGGRDIEAKSLAHLYQTEEQIEQDWEGRMQDRIAFLQALVKEGLLPEKVMKAIPMHAPDVFARAAYAFLARTPCRVMIIPLEDLLGELEAPNLPGASSDAYPSWQLRLRRPFHVFRHDSRIPSLVRSVPSYRKRLKL